MRHLKDCIHLRSVFQALVLNYPANLELSQVFARGASSSTWLFITFIDGLVKFLKERCVEEPLTGLLHCLLHADDTAIVGTSREKFITKCNLMIEYFNENQLTLNFSKSAYMIINGKNELKTDIELSNGNLEYVSSYTYLGTIITDSGSIKHDVLCHINSKRSNLTIKYSNFCRKNYLAPLYIKQMVLDTCVNAALVYGCESWGNYLAPTIDTIYRQGLKTALSIRHSVNNEIVYVESDRYPLTIRIKKQQLKFWLSLQDLDPQHHISKFILLAVNLNIPYIKHYKNLETLYQNPKNCQDTLRADFTAETKVKFEREGNIDPDSRLGAYLQCNPLLTCPTSLPVFEPDRITVTRYRTGSHQLKIETGRFSVPHIPRDERLCPCFTAVQTLKHCLQDCPLLSSLRTKHSVTTLNDINNPSISNFLNEMECVFKIHR